MKNLFVSIVVYCLMATQAFGFSTTFSGNNYKSLNLMPSISVSWWNPMSYVDDVFSFTSSTVSNYFGFGQESETEEKENSYADTFSSYISNTWFNLTSFPLIPGSNSSCMATNSNGPGCVICNNTGLIALNNIQSNLMCNMSSEQRIGLNSKQKCHIASMSSSDVDKCATDETAKNDYCQSCLETDGGLPDQTEVADLIKKAVKIRKDELIRQTFKDYKAISEETLDFIGNPYLQEGIGVNFLCSPGKIVKLKEELMTNPLSGCKEESMNDIKDSIVGFVEYCAESKDSSCPQNIPTSFLSSLNDKNNHSDISQLEGLVSPEVKMLQIADSLVGMTAEAIKGLRNYDVTLSPEISDQTSGDLQNKSSNGIVRTKSMSIMSSQHEEEHNENAIRNEAMYTGTQFVADNNQLFSVENYNSNLKKIFDPGFDCQGDDCQALYTYLEFDPSIGSILSKASQNGKLDAKSALLKFKDVYAMYARKDISKQEAKNNAEEPEKVRAAIKRNLKILNDRYDLTKSEETLKEIEAHNTAIIKLNTHINNRTDIIFKQNAFLDQLDNNQKIEPIVFDLVASRMQRSRIEDLEQKCGDVVANFGQICRMDNQPESYKATDFIGVDFSTNGLLAEKLLDGKFSNQEDKNKKIKKLSIILDKVSCYEQNKYASPSLKIGSSGHQTFYSLAGAASSCLGQGQIRKGSHSQFAIFQEDPTKVNDEGSYIDYNYQSISKCPEPYQITGVITEQQNDQRLLGLAGLVDNAVTNGYSIGAANEGSLYTPIVSNPNSSVASAINKINKNSRYKDKISSSDIKSVLAAAGGKGKSTSSKISTRTNTLSDKIGEEITTNSGEVSNAVGNATNQLIDQDQTSGLSSDQVASITNEIAKNENVRNQTEQIINNDKAVNKIEETISEINNVKANSDSPELNTELDAKLALLQKQIEDLKKQNETLKSNRDLEIARIRDDKIQQQIAQNNANTGAFDVDVTTNSNQGAGTTASVSNNTSSSSTESSNVSNLGTTSSGSTTTTVSPETSGQTYNGQTNVTNSIVSGGLESQGLILDSNALKLTASDGRVLASGDELLIVADSVQSLQVAKKLALSKKKQAFVFKGKAYMKKGLDYILAPQRRSIASRTEMAQIEQIQQIDDLLETLEQDPFEFDDSPSLQTTKIDPVIETKMIKEEKVERDRAYVSDLLTKLKQGLKL